MTHSQKRSGPDEDGDLSWYFFHEGAEVRAQSYEVFIGSQKMAGDDGLIASGRIDFGGNTDEAKKRRIRLQLAQLDRKHVDVLRRAYGPRIAGLHFLSSDAEGREKLGRWANVLELTGRQQFEKWAAEQRRADKPTGQVVTIFEWLRHNAKKSTLEAIQVSASKAVWEAHQAWRDVRGRRPPPEDFGIEREDTGGTL